MSKNFLKNLVTLVVALGLCALAFEVFLRFLPVSQGFGFHPVNEDQTLFHAEPNLVATSSKDWDFFNARDIVINNAGFRNNQDYTVDGLHPLIGVIGDSYVEAVQVDFDNTFFGLLAARFDGRARVYSFGYSGAPLSQYLIWAQYATREFHADYLTFTIISNDFDQSMGWWKRGPGFHHYEDCGGGDHCLQRVDFTPSMVRPIVEHSALARYLVYNLQVQSLGQNISAVVGDFFDSDDEPAYVANVDATVSQDRLDDSKLAVDLFFRDLPAYTGLPPANISFLVDGRLYDEDATPFDESFFGIIRRYFITQALAKGYDVVDLRPVFSRHFETYGQKFESERDGHWNELGHGVAAEALGVLYEQKVPEPRP